MALPRGCLLALLLAAMTLSGPSAESEVYVRFKLLEPTETSYCVQIGGCIHLAEPGGHHRVTLEATLTREDKESAARGN